MKRIQRSISFLLALVMVFGMLPPMEVHAEGTEPIAETEAVMAVEETTSPTEVMTEPAEETTVLSEPVTESTEEDTEPTEVETESIEETTDSTETVTDPTEETTAPSKAVTESTEEAAVPFEEEPDPTEELEQIEQEPMQADDSVVASGTCGDNLTWTLSDNGILTIRGTGEMQRFSSHQYRPWANYTDSINTVKIDNGVTSISQHAFQYCQNMISITLPDSITSIGYYAFYGCSSLSSLTLGSNVSYIDSLGFGTCYNLIAIWVDEDNAYFSSDSCGVLYDKDKNTLVRVPCALSGEFCIPDGVVSIKDDAFHNCRKLTNVIIPYGVVSIGNSAFLDCDSIQSVIIPESVTNIGYNAFRYCDDLNSVIIGNNVASINNETFVDCYKLSNITIGKGVISIGDAAFYNCDSIHSVTIPAGVNDIGKWAFRSCDSLTNIIFEGNAPSNSDAVFTNTCANAYYPEGNATWTTEIMESYGGEITWIPYGIKDANSMFVGQVSVICYANQKAAENPNEKFVLSSAVKATVGSEVYYADSKGQITIFGEPQDWVTFSQEGYVSRSFTLQELSDNNIVYLQKESDGPVIHALWSDKTDILHTELALYYASDTEISLAPEIDWGGSKDSLVLYQDGISLPIFEGSNSVKLASEFDINKEIYLIATNGNGKQARKLLKITNKTETGLDGFTFDLGDSLSFTLPESAGLLAGTKMDLGLYSKVPVKVAVVDGRVYATFGIQWDGSGDVEVKNSVQSIKTLRNAVADCTAGMKEYKYVRDVMKNFGYKTAKLSGSCGVDGNWTLLGYVEGYLDSNRNFILSDSGGIMSFGASVDYTQPFMAGPVPMFFELSFSGDIESQFNLYINQKIKKFTPKVEIEGVLALKGGVGVGAAKVASLSGGFKGSLINNINFNLGVLEHYRLTAALDWYIKLKLLFLSYDYGDTITKATWYEYPDPGKAIMTLGLDDEEPDTGGGKPDFYDASLYTMDDLGYLSYGSSFMGGGVSTFSGRSLNNNAPFVSNAYEGADPQTVTFSDGTRLAVWIGYNENYSGADALNLYYSYYNGAWAQPQLVEQDGTTDAYPDLKVINDTAYLVWQDASGSIGSSATLDSIATMMDISGAVFNKDTASFESSAITSGSDVLNLQPKLCGDSSAVYVVWQRNGENDWFGQNNSNSLWYSSFSGGSWGTPSALYSGLAPLLDFDVACSGGSCIVAYTMDGDGDLNTTEDLEVYKNGAALTDNDWLDSGVTFSGTDLYWYSGGKLVKNGSDTMPEGVFIGSDRFQIVNEHGVHAVVYAEEDGLASILKAAYYDASSGGWGTPKTLYSAGTSISAFSASATADGEISVLVQSQEVTGDFDGTDPYGIVSLVWYNAPMGCDIRVDDVRFYNEKYVQDNDMPVYITVTNVGELAVQKLQIELIDETDMIVHAETINQQLLSGETKEIEITYYVKDVVPGRTLTLNVTPLDMEDVFPEDNTGDMVLGWEDLSVEDLRAGMTEDGEIIIHANIVNRGYQPQENVTIYLREKNVSGTILETIELESIEELSRQPVSFALRESLSKIYYVTIDRKESEYNSANNSDFINISAYLGDDVIYGDNAVVIHVTDLEDQTSVWVDGTEYALKQYDTTRYVNLPDGNAKTMIAYTYHVGDASDVHTQYPVSMKVWTLSNTDGIYTATRVEELDDILQYSGCSIRITGKQGIRMITSIDEADKAALTGNGLAGYTLKEYGTAIAWADQLSGKKPLVLGKSYVRYNYAYSKENGKDPIYDNVDGRMQYTNVLVGFGLNQCNDDIAIRPYMILEDDTGNEITLYGGIVERSIGYIASDIQKKNLYASDSPEYKYLQTIIEFSSEAN